jgi:hypothetical protein
MFTDLGICGAPAKRFAFDPHGYGLNFIGPGLNQTDAQDQFDCRKRIHEGRPSHKSDPL